jgi:hypothetical protein
MEKDESMIRPIQAGVSIINENPIGILEKLGKYEFVYDYNAVPAPFWSLGNNYLTHHSATVTNDAESVIKPTVSNTNVFYSFDGDGTGNLSSIRWEALFPQPVKVSSEAKVGVFSKGNIVNVVRFDGNNAIIENVNYKAPDPTVVKSVWGELLGGVINKKELSIPKDYLRKADDNLEPTLLTGINYGANMKPQPIYVTTPVKPIPQVSSEVTLEENASFVLTKDFQFITGYGSSFCSPDGLCTADMSPKYSTLKAGTKVTGRLFKTITTEKKNIFSTQTVMPNSIEKDYLEVKGYSSQGSINIPIEYLTKEVPTNSGVVVPAQNNNKNLLMIVGAFLVGYVVFSKGKANN